ncbi:DNA primase [Thermosynechococcaceae cyanobacterium BACA0444]|uniref:DNA primase n=1 Tax=Pseudocalidococcus azoricus BACA0444 TaxID=2918990 RepID=A0AAE4FQF3_9CYAN|nr:DNA primase [Pseudocalidococcus azoricus]MDS3860270.1 DNA primase [Pseudocalidococcus azoricus BACA0444]
MTTAPRLHPDTIEQVRARVDIVEVVSDHVALRKRGKDFVGCCPFHDEKSPSFSVSPAKGFYYCFGCGAGGNAVKFLMEVQKRSFSEVVLDLAQRYQVPVRTVDEQQRQALQQEISLKEQLYEILALTCSFYEHALRQPTGQAALEYAVHKRGLDQATIQQFQIGYAPAGWQVLYRYLVEQKGYPASLVEQAGLIVPRNQGDGYYDRFRDRLVIPIHDPQGRVVGFGSRTLTNEEPKYLNSPETPLFSKGKLLFGLDKARHSIAKQDQAIVVEGYFDVIALHRAGITQAVATLGTALSKEQVRQLLRYLDSKQVILNFDADKAGEKAAQRAIGEVADLAYSGDVQLRILTIPQGKDPDEFLQQHSAQDYLNLVTAAPLWLDWQIQGLLDTHDLSQADQFQDVTHKITALLGKLPSATLRSHYIHRCAELLGQGDTRLTLRLEESLRQQVRGQRWHGRGQKWQRPTDTTLRETAEAQLLRIYLHIPSERVTIHKTLRERDLEFTFSHHRFLWRQILDIEEKAFSNFSNVNKSFPENLYIDEWVPVHNDDNLILAVQDLYSEFHTADFRKQIEHLFKLDERTSKDLITPRLAIEKAANELERIICEKRLALIQEELLGISFESINDIQTLCKQVDDQYTHINNLLKKNCLQEYPSPTSSIQLAAKCLKNILKERHSIIINNINLISVIQELCTDYPVEIKQVFHLFHLDEFTYLNLHRSSLLIKAAAASLERIAVEKRCRYFLQTWQETLALLLQESLGGEALKIFLEDQLTLDEVTIAEDFPGVSYEKLLTLKRLQDDYYKHRDFLQKLDKQRCPDWSDIVVANQEMMEPVD